jgi:hypothetical protein
MKKNKSRRQSRGQAILIVLLASAVIMTLGLSSARRTVIDTKIDTDEELLKQAFNTAESGVDYYLSTGETDYSDPDTNSSAQVTVNPIGLGTSLSSDGVVLSNTPALFWLVSHNSDGSINSSNYFTGNTVDICVDDNFSKALKIDYFYLSGGSYKVMRKGINFSDSTEFNFSPVGTSNKCISQSINNLDTPLLLAVTPINGSTKLIVKDLSGNNFPIQGQEITSVGRAGDVSAGSVGVNTQVKVINRYLVPPFMLDAITAANNVLSK